MQCAQRPSRSLKEAINRLDNTTQSIKEDAAHQSNTVVLAELLEKIK